jgi:hypothetical protein
MSNKIQIGDTIICIQGGGNNTSINLDIDNCAGFNDGESNGPFIIINILDSEPKHMAYSLDNANTLVTECGKYLWNHSRFYTIVEKNTNTNYQIY